MMRPISPMMSPIARDAQFLKAVRSPHTPQRNPNCAQGLRANDVLHSKMGQAMQSGAGAEARGAALPSEIYDELEDEVVRKMNR